MERQLCQFQTVSTKGFTPGDRAKRVTGVIELEGIRDSELASNISERVLESAQSDMTRARLLRRKDPALSWAQLFKLSCPEKCDDALAQRRWPTTKNDLKLDTWALSNFPGARL